MKTTQMIELLKKYEHGGATGRSREVYFEVDDRIIETDGIEFIEAGDGLVTDLTLSLPDAKPHWIPCSERLPEKRKENEDTEYLVTIDNGEFKYVTSDYWINWFGNWRWNDSEAIAWMPLPKPYGGESDV